MAAVAGPQPAGQLAPVLAASSLAPAVAALEASVRAADWTRLLTLHADLDRRLRTEAFSADELRAVQACHEAWREALVQAREALCAEAASQRANARAARRYLQHP
ncbi:MAG: hypothetical protein SV108_06590 [Pseudomonadota bacterium]|nr:hypothetical protein [Pseudomonadota bacterium]HJO35832.1 hypothetical protein [Gammaproteobacteria bacterium]